MSATAMTRHFLFLLSACLTARLLPAAVTASMAGGFTAAFTVEAQATPEDVYRKLTDNVADWWNPSHTFSGSSRNLTIDARPSGCFCEKFPSGGGVRHLEVVFAQPGKMLRMAGALGPMQGMGVSGALTILLTPSGQVTKISVTYSASGMGVEKVAAPADGMLSDQFARLKNFIETGDPAKSAVTR